LIHRKTLPFEKESGGMKRKTARPSRLQRPCAGLPMILKKEKKTDNKRNSPILKKLTETYFPWHVLHTPEEKFPPIRLRKSPSISFQSMKRLAVSDQLLLLK